MMWRDLSRGRRIAALLAVAALLGVAIPSVAHAVQGDPIPGVDVSIEQSPGGLAISTNPSSLTFTVKKGALTPTPGQVTLAVQGKPTPIVVLGKNGAPNREGTVTIKGTLTGTMSCESGAAVIASGSLQDPPPSGNLTVAFKVQRAASGAGSSHLASNNYNSAKSNTAGVMMPGGDPNSTSDYSLVGLINSGPAAGQFVVIDGYLTTPLPYDWWNCGHETGGYTVTKLVTANADPYPTGDGGSQKGFLYIGSLCGLAVRDPNTGDRVVVGNNEGVPKTCS